MQINNDQPTVPTHPAPNHPLRTRAVGLLVVLTLLLTVMAEAAGAQPAGGRLLYFDGTNWITASLDGTGRTKITNESVTSDEGLALSAARFSPDGTRIARPDQSGQRVIHTALDGTDPRVVVENDRFGQLIGGNNKNPFWSPSGTEIAYFTDRNFRWELWITPADGSSEGRMLMQVTTNGASALADIVGDWSSAGDRMVFSYAPPSQLELGVVRVLDAGGNTVSSFDGLWPSFSPDGSTIAYTNRSTGTIELRDRNGGNRRTLPTTGAWVKWSGDGDRLLATTLDGDVVSMTVAGTNITTIVDDASVNIRADWAGSETAVAQHYCRGERATIVGTGGNDRLTGTAGRDVIVGLGGNDVINGRGGNDVICGDAGNDTLVGGRGAVVLSGGAGRDKIRGQGGRDLIFGDGGRDKIRGGAGADEIHGGAGKDRIVGVRKNDTVVA